MAYFPLFIDMSGLPCLVVGGGRVAARKVRTLLEYGASVTVAAPEIAPEIEALEGVAVLKRPFQPLDLEGQRLVFAATDDESCNRNVAELARMRHIPVNVADVADCCDFYFPALVKRGEAVVGISTGGSSPLEARRLRETIDALLPEALGALTERAGAYRKEILSQGQTPEKDEGYREMVNSFFASDLREYLRQKLRQEV